MAVNNLKRNIFIRADGNKEIGYGHIKRAVIISEFLLKTRNINTILLSNSDTQNVVFADYSSIELINIDPECSIKDETEFVCKMAQKYQPLFIILDVLENDVNHLYMANLRKINVPIAVITDDSYKREIDSDLVLNGNPNQLYTDYGDLRHKYLLGPKYFIMSSKYENIVATYPNKNKFKKVILTLGGSDHHNLTFKTIQALSNIDEIDEILIISSHATGYSLRLKSLLKNKKIKMVLDVPTLAPYFQKADIAVTAGGNTLFERIATHVPGVTICQLQRQMEIADSFERMDVNYNIGFGPDLTVEEIQTKTKSFILDYNKQLKQYEQSHNVIDGKGLKRFCQKLDQLIKTSTI
ncbi:MAG: hypothetical protein IH852_09430 [Bacteroidetes bacterium]|nr:hypothetical protein [Bacteroidota bacterium]